MPRPSQNDDEVKTGCRKPSQGRKDCFLRFRTRIKRNLICAFALGIFPATALKAELLNGHDSPGINPTDLSSSELVCTGAFIKNIDNPYYDIIKRMMSELFQGDEGVAEFKIDEVLKGERLATVKVFLSHKRRYGRINPPYWNGRMLLVLKRDIAYPVRYSFVNPANSWLLLPDTATKNSASSKTLDGLLVEQLISIYQIPADLNFSAAEMDRVPWLPPFKKEALFSLKYLRLAMLRQATETIIKCRYGDDSLMAALGRFSQFPDVNTRTDALNARIRVGSKSVSQNAYNEGLKLLESSDVQEYEKMRLGHAIKGVVENAKNSGDIDWLASLLNSDDPALRWEAARAIRTEKLTESTLLLLGSMLEGNDGAVQFHAIIGIYQSAKKLGMGKGLPVCPGMVLFNENPDYYVSLWRPWWEAHHERLLLKLGEQAQGTPRQPSLPPQ